MSIVDRITALLNRPSFLCSPKARFNQMYQVLGVLYKIFSFIILTF